MALAELNTTGHRTALKIVVTSADTSVASGDYQYLRTKIEGQDMQSLQYGTANAKTVTLSFWVKSSLAGVYCTGLLLYSSTTYFCPQEFTISDADTWEKKTITITPTAGSTSLVTGAGGLVDNDNTQGLAVLFNLMAGSSINGGTTNTWATANQATSNQTNLFAATHNFYLTGVQLELGSSATPFEHRTYGDVLQQCKRYFERFNFVAADQSFTYGWCNGTAAGDTFLKFDEKRTTPTASTTAAATWAVQDDAGTTVGTGVTVDNLNVKNGRLRVTTAGTPFTSGDGCRILRDGSDVTYVDIISEL